MSDIRKIPAEHVTQVLKDIRQHNNERTDVAEAAVDSALHRLLGNLLSAGDAIILGYRAGRLLYNQIRQSSAAISVVLSELRRYRAYARSRADHFRRGKDTGREMPEAIRMRLVVEWDIRDIAAMHAGMELSRLWGSGGV